MDSLILIALLVSLLFNFFLLFLVRQSQKDIKEIARESLLASKATSAEDLAGAAIIAHQAAEDRENPPKPLATGLANPNAPEPPQLRGHDGRVLQALRPLG